MKEVTKNKKKNGKVSFACVFSRFFPTFPPMSAHASQTSPDDAPSLSDMINTLTEYGICLQALDSHSHCSKARGDEATASVLKAFLKSVSSWLTELLLIQAMQSREQARPIAWRYLRTVAAYWSKESYLGRSHLTQLPALTRTP